VPLLRILSILALTALAAAEPIPRIAKQDGAYRLLVNGRPFLLLGAQVRNSSGWPSQLPDVWAQMKALHVNTVEIPVYWEQVEPRPGQFDFTNVDEIVRQARAQNFRLVLLWFATWKNGQMDYAPEWVKRDTATYRHMLNRAGQPVRVLSPHCRANLDADSKAFAAFMAHLKQTDEEPRTVIMVQVENEPGSLETVRDYSPEANQLFSGRVPDPLVQALRKKPGTWTEVFGPEAEEAFAAYHVATYVNAVAEAGRKVYPLPLYVNVWLREEKTFMRPAENYPSGGATTNVLDLWKAVTPAIDVIAPDIYVQHYRNYQEVCAAYNRADNPLLIPETGGSGAFSRYLFYAVGDYGTLGFAPFGVNAQDTKTLNERLAPMARNFELLGAAAPDLIPLQSTGKLKSAVEEQSLTNRLLHFDGYDVVAMFGFPPQVSYGGLFAPGTKDTTGRALIGQLGPDEFLVLGFDSLVQFRPPMGAAETTAQFLRVEEGVYENGVWKMRRLLNGDEAFFGLRLPPNGVTLRVRLMKY
jgi:hypothetical protein